MSKNPNSAENTKPYQQIDAGSMRSEAVRHGNSGYNKQINAGEMRSEAEKKGSTESSHVGRHESAIASLDHKAGKEKGGR